MTRSPFGNTGGFANPNPRTLTPCPRCKRLRDASRQGPCGNCATTRRRKDDDK